MVEQTPDRDALRKNASEHPLPQQDGVLVLAKPGGISSAACIARIRRGLGQKKIGHAGTLDPLATGVLLVLLGQATKLSGPLLDGGKKIYSGVIRLGMVTDTWDVEGETLETRPVAGIDAASVKAAMAGFVGRYEQPVPAFSAAKHRGKPLYELARKGAAVPEKKKLIEISRGEAELVGPERIRFRVTCGSGTYIRSLAHSLGMRLGCGAALETLSREYSHPFGIEQAHPLEETLADPEGFPSRVTGIAEALPGWPKLRLSREEEARVRNGASLAYLPETMGNIPFSPGLRALFQDENGKALALAETDWEEKSGRGRWALVRGLWNPWPEKKRPAKIGGKCCGIGCEPEKNGY
jgi:tRNA pseudouridine55 synthase